MVEQEDIIALTKHVRSFSDALNNLRNNFKDSVVGQYIFIINICYDYRPFLISSLLTCKKCNLMTRYVVY